MSTGRRAITALLERASRISGRSREGLAVPLTGDRDRLLSTRGAQPPLPVPLGRRARPGGCFGTVFVVGYVSRSGLQPATAGSTSGGVGSFGMDVSGAARLSALVRSPHVSRRHCERFGTSTPKRVSRNRSVE